MVMDRSQAVSAGHCVIISQVVGAGRWGRSGARWCVIGDGAVPCAQPR
jgi:hypothetical protein